MNIISNLKKLRDKTSLSIMICKKALEKAGGDIEKAIDNLRLEGHKIAGQKSERQTQAGIIEAYIHSNKKIGVLLELKSETDFVARNPEFQNLAHDLAMHIAASSPINVDELLNQPFIKNCDITVKDLIEEHIAKFGENIEIFKFIKYEL